jgi:hypothetical protein
VCLQNLLTPFIGRPVDVKAHFLGVIEDGLGDGFFWETIKGPTD